MVVFKFRGEVGCEDLETRGEQFKHRPVSVTEECL